MCGVYLRVCKNQNCETDHLDSRRLNLISHRGPDGSKLIKIEKNMVIGFTRLAIRALELGDQPHHFLTGISAINGELYNQDEIKSRLTSSSVPEGDMQILGEYLGEYGIGAIKDADGMFAGFLIDSLRNQVHIFRDKVGEKPLFYRITDSHLEVMSENLFDELQRPDPVINSKRALIGFLPEKSKSSSNVERVTPGTYITFDINTFQFYENRYWKWQKRPQGSVKYSAPELKNFRTLLYDSVESRLVADVPVASLLSGGIDSAIITKVAQDILGYPIPAFTLAFKNSVYDESKMARLTAKAIGCDLEVIEMDPETISKLVPICVESMREPILDSACLSLYSLSSIVSKNFIVALTGDGGDELFQGYSLFKNLKFLRFAVRNPKLSQLAINLALSMPNRLYRKTYISSLMKLERVDSVLKHSGLNPLVLALSPLGGTRLLDDLIDCMNFELRKGLSGSAITISAENLEDYYRNEVLPHLYLEKSDRMSMAHGLELRAPLLAPSLIEFANNIPQSEILNGESKVLLRKLASEFLPSEVLATKKHGFSPPLFEIVKHLEEPSWKLEDLGLTKDALQMNWRMAIEGKENASYAAWATLVLNYYS